MNINTSLMSSIEGILESQPEDTEFTQLINEVNLTQMNFTIFLVLGFISFQDTCSYPIAESSFFEKSGVVFTSCHDTHTNTHGLLSRFSPSPADIERADELFPSLYVNRMPEELVKKSMVRRKNGLRNFYRCYVRQYLGFIDQGGNRIILLKLLNFRKKSFQERFENWENQYFTGFGSFYEENLKTFKIDLTNNDLSIW